MKLFLQESEIKNKHSCKSENQYYVDPPTYYFGPRSLMPPIFPIYLSDDLARKEIEDIEMEINGYTLRVESTSSRPSSIQRRLRRRVLKEELEELKAKPLLFSNLQNVSDEIAQNLHRLNEKATILEKELNRHNLDSVEIIQKVNEKILVLENELSSLDEQCKNAFHNVIHQCKRLKRVCNELKVKHTTEDHWDDFLFRLYTAKKRKLDNCQNEIKAWKEWECAHNKVKVVFDEFMRTGF